MQAEKNAAAQKKTPGDLPVYVLFVRRTSTPHGFIDARWKTVKQALAGGAQAACCRHITRVHDY